ncbi:MAG: dual specificity protein phosphatase family protein [Proteobacteria bacterium]|nr:dual specificity protein phosphatase family protein [Pseudomonadota bacterium]
MARPRAGDWLDDEIAGWRAEGVDTVICLLEREEIAELGLHSEAELCQRHGIAFVAYPIPDRGVPASLRDATALAHAAYAMVREGKAVAVHCRAGIGRSSVIAACVLVCAGIPPDSAFAAIAQARGVSVPDTQDERDWVTTFAATVGAGNST